MNNALIGYVSGVLVLLNVGVAAFAAAAPPNSLPWWTIAGFAALNAVVHILPSGGISFSGSGSAPK